jgi:uncharacterized caspase-like protein
VRAVVMFALVSTVVLASWIPASAQPATGERWAVVVGVGAHDNPAISRARFAVADAEAIYQVFIGPMGLAPDHVVLLTDRAARKPTRNNVVWALGTFLGRGAKRDDTVLIYFAGHGGIEVDSRGLERDGLAKYLILRDTDPDDLYSTALAMDTLQDVFARIESERVIAFLDASYSGAAGGRTFATRRSPGGAVDELSLERLARATGRAIIASSRPSEVALGVGELGHGLFTHYLLEGLKGAADRDGNGTVTLQALYEYVERAVTAKARSVGANQHPVMKGELGGPLPLSRVRPP